MFHFFKFLFSSTLLLILILCPQSADKLILLEDGKLRHYTNTNEENEGADYAEEFGDDESKPLFYDYERDQYCIDRVSRKNS